MKKTKNKKQKIIGKDFVFGIRHSAFDSQRGFTLLLAMLAASIALVLGTSIFEISTKEVQLSSIGRDSELAFYAADTGAECALYWDDRFQYFGTTTPSGLSSSQPDCDGQTLAGYPSGTLESQRPTSSFSSYTMTFQFEPNKYCANVSVLKCECDALSNCIKADGSCVPVVGPLSTYQTLVHADGYNTTCSKLTPANPSALQRSVELNY